MTVNNTIFQSILKWLVNSLSTRFYRPNTCTTLLNYFLMLFQKIVINSLANAPPPSPDRPMYSPKTNR